MLVISRRVGEEVVIGETVIVRIKHTSRSQVKLVISAPEDVAIRRAELPLLTARDRARRKVVTP